jgi:DNA-binding response OmpR family regulator
MNGRVMIMDDNPDVVETVKAIFRQREPDIEVIGATSGQEALSIMHESPPDLVLIDIMMPEVDGWDVMVEMQKDPKLKNVPIIYLTAKTDDTSKMMGEMTSEDYITKPFDNEDLVRRVKKVLE